MTKNTSSCHIEEQETMEEVIEDMMAEYNLPDVTNILMRGEEIDYIY